MTRFCCTMFLALVLADAARANDFPTQARVEFVLDCMRSSKASPQESMYKCSCAIDYIATKVNYATWVDLSTVAEIGSTFIHETTLKIRETFDSASDHAPALLFVDEFESMVPARRSLGAHQHHTSEEVSEFLKQLESCAQRRIVLIAATNEPWKIDSAVIRTGRLDKLIYVPAPDAHRARRHVALPSLRPPAVRRH